MTQVPRYVKYRVIGYHDKINSPTNTLMLLREGKVIDVEVEKTKLPDSELDALMESDTQIALWVVEGKVWDLIIV